MCDSFRSDSFRFRIESMCPTSPAADPIPPAPPAFAAAGGACGAAIRGVRWFGDDPALARRDTGMRARAGPTHLSKKWVRDEAVLKPACFLNLLHRIYDRGRCRVPEWGRAR